MSIRHTKEEYTYISIKKKFMLLVHDKYIPIEPNSTENYIKQSIDYRSLMKRHIRKHHSYMQPIYEAISNAFEATKGLGDTITIRLRLSRAIAKMDFLSLEIEDSGIGFNEVNFDRLQRLYDESKNNNNLGTGRIQFLHFFDKTDIYSVYEEKGKKYMRRIVLSANFYPLNNAVIWASQPVEVEGTKVTGTSIAFFYPLDEADKNYYGNLSSEDIYNKILIHYLDKLCINKGNLQTINIETYINGEKDASQDKTINKDSIPTPDYQTSFELGYQVYDKDKKAFVNIKGKNELFQLTSYLLSPKLQSKNQIKLTSKNETIDSNDFDFAFLEDALKIDNKFMLCLISSDYFTKNDSDERGNLHLITKNDYWQSNDAFIQESSHIFIDDIQNSVENRITEHYPEIKKAKEVYDENLEELIKLFSLNREIIKKMGFKYGETKASFLKRYKMYDAELEADNDTKISQLFDSMRTLNPSDPHFKSKLNKKVKEITALIPEKNRASVADYISSRKAVLKILELILEKKLLVQENNKKHMEKERLIHDLLFKKHTTNTYDSNLWILNEDFIHFQGVSESELRNAEYGGEKIIREDLTAEEIAKLKSYNRDQLAKRTDILLFPQEHKCIIIELKSTEADVTKYLLQIVDYAGLIRQYTKEKFEITNFYGYLIGESFDFDAIVNAWPEFIESPYLDYVYIPDQKINGGKYRTRGTMYFEVLKYSSLLERAKIRNSVFFDKIFK